MAQNDLLELGFGIDAIPNRAVVRKAYLAKAFACHPDRAERTGLESQDAKRRFQNLQNAYERLHEALHTADGDAAPAGARSDFADAPSAQAAPFDGAAAASSSSSPSASSGGEAPEVSEAERIARDALRRRGVERFVTELLLEPESSWWRRLVYCGVGEVKRGGRGSTRSFRWRRPQIVLDALHSYVQELTSGSAVRQRPKRPTVAAGASAEAGIALMRAPETSMGMWQKRSGWHVQRQLKGVMVCWLGKDGGESILARMLVHYVVSTMGRTFKDIPGAMGWDGLSKALVDAVSRAEALEFEGWPLPLTFGSTVTPLGARRVHTKYFCSLHRAMRARRLQQRILEENGSKSSLEAYEQEMRDVTERVPARGEVLTRLQALLATLTEPASRKRKAAASAEAPLPEQVPAVPEPFRRPPASALAAALRQQVLGFVRPLPLYERLEKLAALRREGLLGAREFAQATRLELRASMVELGPPNSSAAVPRWFLKMSRSAGFSRAELPEVWQEVWQHHDMQRIACRAIGDVRAGRVTFQQLADASWMAPGMVAPAAPVAASAAAWLDDGPRPFRRALPAPTPMPAPPGGAAAPVVMLALAAGPSPAAAHHMRLRSFARHALGNK